MSIFAISDLHLSFGCDKPMSVFGTKWDNYTERMREKWNSVVTDDDYVIIPGDVSWATYIEDAVHDFDYINRLNGRKLILKGNHDYWWTTANKMNNFLEANNFNSIEIIHNSSKVIDNVAVCGTRGWVIPSPLSNSEDRRIFDREKQRLILSLENAAAQHCGEIIVAMHYPPVDKNSPNSDFIDIMSEYNVKLCVFGHLHASAHEFAPLGTFSGIKLKLVSCDYLNFTPILIR